MTRPTRIALIQAEVPRDLDLAATPVERIKQAMIDLHRPLVAEAAEGGAKIICLQELFYGPYFPAEQHDRWRALAEPIPGGPTIRLMQEEARRHDAVLIVPIMEEAMTGVHYNSAAVIDRTGAVLGRYRKHHLPHCHPGFWEKFYFTPGNEGYPVFETDFGKVGVYVCYDRHFPEGARALGLGGAEIVLNPSATVAGLSEYLWRIEQPAHAVANQYFVGAINRVGTEAPWSIGEFYGSSYVCDTRGQLVAQAARDRTEVLVAEIDLDQIRATRNVWQFYRDRRPETYHDLID